MRRLLIIMWALGLTLGYGHLGYAKGGVKNPNHKVSAQNPSSSNLNRETASFCPYSNSSRLRSSTAVKKSMAEKQTLRQGKATDRQ